MVSRKLVVAISVLCVTLLYSSQSVLIALSKVDGRLPYSPITATLLAELAKLLICLCLMLVRRVPFNFIWKENLLYLVPASIYVVDNNLVFVILLFYDPATYHILANIKVITTALAFRYFLKRTLNRDQWAALVLLTVGIVTCESGQLPRDCPTPSKSIVDLGYYDYNYDNSTAYTTTGDSDEEEQVTQVSSLNGSPTRGTLAPSVGFALVLITSIFSAIADVYMEHIFKKRFHDSILFQNFQLYLYGVVLNFVSFLIMSAAFPSTSPSLASFFRGYSILTGFIILSMACAGLCIAAILKYADNIVRVYASSCAMIGTMLLSVILFDLRPTLPFLCGIVVVITSIIQYNRHSSARELPANEIQHVETTRDSPSHQTLQTEGESLLQHNATESGLELSAFSTNSPRHRAEDAVQEVEEA